MEEKKNKEPKKCYCHNCGEYVGLNVYWDDRWCGKPECEAEAAAAEREEYQRELDDLNERYRHGF